MTQVDTAPGSTPLKPRLEAFVQNVADGITLAESWALSATAVGKAPASIPANRVSGSRANARPDVQQRISFLKRANIDNSPDQDVDSTTLMAIMDDVSGTLRLAIDTCEAHGEGALSQRLRSTLVQHVSRHNRAGRKVGDTPDDKIAIDTSAMLKRLETHGCECEK